MMVEFNFVYVTNLESGLLGFIYMTCFAFSELSLSIFNVSNGRSSTFAFF